MQATSMKIKSTYKPCQNYKSTSYSKYYIKCFNFLFRSKANWKLRTFAEFENTNFVCHKNWKLTASLS